MSRRVETRRAARAAAGYAELAAVLSSARRLLDGLALLHAAHASTDA